MDVSPGKAWAEDVFLHFIQVGDLSMSEMTPAELIQEDSMVGISFNVEGRETTVTFATEGRASYHIHMILDKQVIVDRQINTKRPE